MKSYFLPVAICFAVVASMAFPEDAEAGRRRRCQSCAAPANYYAPASSPYAPAVVPVGATANDDLYETVWQCNGGRCSPVRRLKVKAVAKPVATPVPLGARNKASTATPAKPAEIAKPKPAEPATTPVVIVESEPITATETEEDLPKVHFGPAVHFDDSNIPDVPQLVKSVIASDAPKP